MLFTLTNALMYNMSQCLILLSAVKIKTVCHELDLKLGRVTDELFYQSSMFLYQAPPPLQYLSFLPGWQQVSLTALCLSLLHTRLSNWWMTQHCAIKFWHVPWKTTVVICNCVYLCPLHMPLQKPVARGLLFGGCPSFPLWTQHFRNTLREYSRICSMHSLWLAV